MPLDDDPDGTPIHARAVQPGMDVTVYVFPQGRFGQADQIDGVPRPLGERRRGVIAAVQSIDCLLRDDAEEWTMPGVRVTFADGTTWDGVGHALGTWHGGLPPSPSDLKAAEADIADREARAAEEEAGWEAEGPLSEFHIHPGEDQDGEIMVVMHLVDQDGEVFLATPDQAEAFALRMLRGAAMARLLQAGVVGPMGQPDGPGLN